MLSLMKLPTTLPTQPVTDEVPGYSKSVAVATCSSPVGPGGRFAVSCVVVGREEDPPLPPPPSLRRACLWAHRQCVYSK